MSFVKETITPQEFREEISYAEKLSKYHSEQFTKSAEDAFLHLKAYKEWQDTFTRLKNSFKLEGKNV